MRIHNLHEYGAAGDGITLENICAKGKTGLTVVNADGVVMTNATAETI